METKKISLEKLAEAWSSPFVARSEVKRFSGGILHPGTLANHDSLGTGPKGRIRIGRKVVYPVQDLISWMQERAVIIA